MLIILKNILAMITLKNILSWIVAVSLLVTGFFTFGGLIYGIVSAYQLIIGLGWPVTSLAVIAVLVTGYLTIGALFYSPHKKGEWIGAASLFVTGAVLFSGLMYGIVTAYRFMIISDWPFVAMAVIAALTAGYCAVAIIKTHFSSPNKKPDE